MSRRHLPTRSFSRRLPLLLALDGFWEYHFLILGRHPRQTWCSTPFSSPWPPRPWPHPRPTSPPRSARTSTPSPTSSSSARPSLSLRLVATPRTPPLWTGPQMAAPGRQTTPLASPSSLPATATTLVTKTTAFSSASQGLPKTGLIPTSSLTCITSVRASRREMLATDSPMSTTRLSSNLEAVMLPSVTEVTMTRLLPLTTQQSRKPRRRACFQFSTNLEGYWESRDGLRTKMDLTRVAQGLYICGTGYLYIVCLMSEFYSIH